MTSSRPPVAADAGIVGEPTRRPAPVAPFAQRLSVAKAILAQAAELDDSTLKEVVDNSGFGDVDHLLEFLHSRWVNLFGVALDEQLESNSGNLATSVDWAWREVACREAPLYQFLSRFASHPVIRAAAVRHRHLIATSGVELPILSW